AVAGAGPRDHLGPAGGVPGRRAQGRAPRGGLRCPLRRHHQFARRRRRRPLHLQHPDRTGRSDGVHPDPGRAVVRRQPGRAGMMPDPVGSYSFFVTLDPGDAYLPIAQALLVPLIANGAFQEVKGLGADLEVLSYPEGGVNDFVHQLPVRHSWNRLSLRRGVARGPALWDWYYAGLTNSLGARRDGAVFLLNPDGVPSIAWTFTRGIAVKWT